MTNETQQARRAAFEAEFKDYDLSSFDDDAGTTFFEDTYVQALWRGFNAAIDSIVIDIPEPHSTNGGDCVIDYDEVRDAIHAAGVKTR